MTTENNTNDLLATLLANVESFSLEEEESAIECVALLSTSSATLR